ncbi:MAG TPA: RNA polymerase subunit sigma-70 [Polyangia bacterium]|jgi:RNA polymerase sigma-70 factor (ECF subfamily)
MNGKEHPGAAVLGDTFAEHRPALLRHCYRMLGSFEEAEDVVQEALLRAWRSRDSYVADAPLAHWLMRIATNACLNALTRGRARALPQLERAPGAPLVEHDAAAWVTPAPDARLYPDPAGVVEAREQVALAFIALLQRLPPKQRAVLLLKDVVGWSADEIASALELTVSAVNSALHRARETVASGPPAVAEEPPPEVLAAYLRSWERRDVDSLVALLRKDVVFAMPPHATWFRGAEAVRAFLETPRFGAFWTGGLRGSHTRANGLPALVWYARKAGDDAYRLHSIQLMRFEGGAVAEATNFIGVDYLRGFALPPTL